MEKENIIALSFIGAVIAVFIEPTVSLIFLVILFMVGIYPKLEQYNQRYKDVKE